jgi:hypothetical protein
MINFRIAVEGERKSKWSIPKKPVKGSAVKTINTQKGRTVPPQNFPDVYTG